MAITKKIKVKSAPAKKKKVNTNYLTKRILTKAAKTGFTTAAAATMRVMGYNVIVHRGWVVKKYADGRIQKIKKLVTTSKTSLALD